jgi:ankyrin repeat protein
MRALADGRMDMVRYLVNCGADVNKCSAGPDGETPLIRAITAEDIPAVHLLIELGADPNCPQAGAGGWTPLMFAHRNPNVIQTLVAAGADARAHAHRCAHASTHSATSSQGHGETALHLAAAAGRPEAVRALVKAGADPESPDDSGFGPLDYALRNGAATQAAEALVEAGAKLTPQRLDLMHAAASDPDRDLANLVAAANGDSAIFFAQNPADCGGKVPLRGISLAGAFQERQRLPLWLYMLCSLSLLLAGTLALSMYIKVRLWSLSMPLLLAWATFSGFVAFRRSGPRCPNCRCNVRLCRASHCHVCGHPLSGGRCGDCRVNQSPLVMLAPLWRYPGNRERVRHCPGCGVFLDTAAHRLLGGGCQ